MKIPGISKIKYQDKIYSLGHRVVTENMQSLGLRNNPNIITYPFQEWVYLKTDQIQKGKSDWGGIWVARTPSRAKGLHKYMKQKHKTPTRIFKSAIDKILYANDYRIKTNAIILLEEIKCQ